MKLMKLMKLKATIATIALTIMAANAGTIVLYDADPDNNAGTLAPDPTTVGWSSFRVNGGSPSAGWGTAGTNTAGDQAWIINDTGSTGSAALNQGGMIVFDITPATVQLLNGSDFTLTMEYEVLSGGGGFHGMGFNHDGTNNAFGRSADTRWATNSPAAGVRTDVFSWNGTTFTNGGNFGPASSNAFFAGDDAGEMRVFFGDNTVNSSTFNIAITSVTLESSAVPEPSSTALLGLGGLALILRRRM